MKKPKGKPKLLTPSTFQFDSLEDQTSHALHTLRILGYMFEGNYPFEFTDQDYEAMAGLLFDARQFLEPLDLRGVAGALANKRFTLVHDPKLRRPTIACTQCSQEKGA